MSSESLLRFAKMARFALIGALLSAAACAGISATAFGGAQLALPGPAPRPRPSGLAAAVTENAKCEGCHQDIAKEWRGSLHQQAWHDPVFQKALAIEPEAFCRGCHAPEADASGEPPKAAQDVGVGCVTCHLQGSDVVGTRAVAAKAPAFGMSVAYTSRSATLEGAMAMPLDRLLATSDVVSLHVPLTPATTHPIDHKALTRMRRSAYLVNTARGPVVDEGALAWALRERVIAGAALDVYEQEPVVHPDLFALDNVLLIPHLASATTETRTAMADLAVSNALAILDGRPALTPVP